MSAYIKGTGNISPQHSFGIRTFQDKPEVSDAGYLNIIPPDYKQFIEPRMLRRMSKILKMGVTAGAQALKDAGIDQPDAIATATALGCTQDTHRFLKEMIEREEQTLSPTSFIQSTHNTIGGQIALQLGLHGYNMTYTQRGVSFESALLDSLLLLESAEADNVLLGGIDELIEPARVLMQRMGLYRNPPLDNSELLDEKLRGSIGGEGASFFVLSSAVENAYAQLMDVDALYQPEISAIGEKCMQFLKRNGLSADDIDLVITGRSGDASGDQWYAELMKNEFSSEAVFKPLCGEYQSASGFAVWMAALAILNNELPEYARYGKNTPADINRILIYNHYQQRNHSFILVTR